MTGATPQIFDLLTGPTGPGPLEQLPGGDTGAVDAGPLFANLLGGLLNGQPLRQNVIDLQQLIAGDDPNLQDGLEQLIPLVDAEDNLLHTQKSTVDIKDSDGIPAMIGIAATEIPASDEVHPMPSVAVSLSDILDQSIQHSLLAAESPLVDEMDAEKGKLADGLNTSSALLPEAISLSNRSLKEILTGGQVMVEPGKYRIIESDVSNGQLNLTVVSSESSTEQIKLSLPLKTLLQEGTFPWKGTALSGLPSIEPSLMEGPMLEDYISRLRLTTLQVEPKVEPPAPTDSKQATLKLLGDLGDRQVVILSHLGGNGLIGRRKVQQDSIDRVGDGPIDIDETFSDPQSGNDTSAGRSTAARPWNDTLLNRPHSLAGKSDQKLTTLSTSTDLVGDNADIVRINELIPPDAKIERPTLDTEGLRLRTPRLSLSEDIRTTLKPGGQAITLRIEPEHLGPARLRLVMHNNVLKALVTVDSTHAKLAVEGSLDQLANQLSKANIQVGRIEVALNTGSRHESFSHRRPRQQASLKSRRNSIAAPVAMTMADSKDRYGAVPRLGVGGVNLLA